MCIITFFVFSVAFYNPYIYYSTRQHQHQAGLNSACLFLSIILPPFPLLFFLKPTFPFILLLSLLLFSSSFLLPSSFPIVSYFCTKVVMIWFFCFYLTIQIVTQVYRSYGRFVLVFTETMKKLPQTESQFLPDILPKFIKNCDSHSFINHKAMFIFYMIFCQNWTSNLCPNLSPTS